MTNQRAETLRMLRHEITVLTQALHALEDLERTRSGHAPRSTRGRKSMGAAERLQVSERMRQYWAGRKGQ